MGVMSSKEVLDSCRYIFDRVNVGDIGPQSVLKVPLDGLNDAQRGDFARYVYGKRRSFKQAGPLGMKVAEAIEDQELKSITLLRVD